MGAFSIWHWGIVLIVAFLVFGGSGKIVRIAKDLGSSIPAFRKGLAEAKDVEKELKKL